MRATPKRERGARDSSPKLNGDGSPSKRRARRPSPAPPPRPSASAAEVAQRLADHDDCVRVASALLEDPRRPRTHADGVRRACQEGHAWLARVTVAEHAEVAVQPALLASVRAPPITYQPALPRRVVKSGALSDLQVEALMSAGQCHAGPLTAAGTRRGFLLADGAGVGKGRTQAAILLDAWLQGHQRALWVSASADLLVDARRDLEAVCTAAAGVPPLHTYLIPLTQLPLGTPIQAPRGIVFASYALLARPARLAQVLAWCEARKAFEGVVALDECHRAKAAGSTGAGSAVLRLQTELPLARVVYSSATCATELQNVEYLTRLALWGRGTPHPNFGAFREAMAAGGAAAKELLPVHLKCDGALLSRLISFEGVAVRVATHQLTPAQRRLYNSSARLWLDLARLLRRRAPLLPPSAGSRFWSAHQRFFRCLVTALKLPTLHAMLREGLAAGKSVVVGLLGTGEAYNSAPTEPSPVKAEAGGGGAAAAAEGDGAAAAVETTPPAPSAILKAVISSVLFPEAAPTHREVAPLLARAAALDLPPNPLDDIMRTLAADGVPAVELSGRQEVAPHRNAQRARFQSGEATVAVISDAASTGVSLHATRGADGTQPVRPRLHITLELNWSADRQIQQLGRTHRTGQACPPEHVLLVSDVSGEKRFVSTIARRLHSLGALSGEGGGGGSRLAEGKWGDVLESLETPQGSSALQQLYMALGIEVNGADEDDDAERRRARAALNQLLRHFVTTGEAAAREAATAAAAAAAEAAADGDGDDADGESDGDLSESEGSDGSGGSGSGPTRWRGGRRRRRRPVAAAVGARVGAVPAPMTVATEEEARLSGGRCDGSSAARHASCFLSTHTAMATTTTTPTSDVPPRAGRRGRRRRSRCRARRRRA